MVSARALLQEYIRSGSLPVLDELSNPSNPQSLIESTKDGPPQPVENSLPGFWDLMLVLFFILVALVVAWRVSIQRARMVREHWPNKRVVWYCGINSFLIGICCPFFGGCICCRPVDYILVKGNATDLSSPTAASMTGIQLPEKGEAIASTQLSSVEMQQLKSVIDKLEMASFVLWTISLLLLLFFPGMDLLWVAALFTSVCIRLHRNGLKMQYKALLGLPSMLV
jgi:hypothetical protein